MLQRRIPSDAFSLVQSYVKIVWMDGERRKRCYAFTARINSGSLEIGQAPASWIEIGAMEQMLGTFIRVTLDGRLETSSSRLRFQTILCPIRFLVFSGSLRCWAA